MVEAWTKWLTPILPKGNVVTADEKQKLVHDHIGRCLSFLKVRGEYFAKYLELSNEAYETIEKADSDLIKTIALDMRSILAGVLMDNMNAHRMLMADNVVLTMLVSLTSIFLTDSLDVASMKEQMEAYAKFMAQLQTQAKGREIREPLTQEPWFNLIWDRQKKRGVIT